MNMEAQAIAGTANNEGEEKQLSFEANAARAAAIQQEIAEAAAQGDFAKIAELSAEGQQLKSANEGVVAEDHQEGLEMNAEMDAEKSRQEAEAKQREAEEAAARAEQARLDAEKAVADQSAAEKLAAEIKRGVQGSEIANQTTLETDGNKEQQESSEMFKVFGETAKFDKNGKLTSTFTSARLDAQSMLDAYRRNQKNSRWISRQLMSDPSFVEQMRAIEDERCESLGLPKKEHSEQVNLNAFDEVKDNPPTSENVAKAKQEAIIYNLANGSRTAEEMGASKEDVAAALEDTILSRELGNYDNTGPAFGSGKSLAGVEGLGNILNSIGEDGDEIIMKSEIRAAVQQAYPSILRRAFTDGWGEELVRGFEKTFKVSGEEKKMAVTSYLQNRRGDLPNSYTTGLFN